MDQSQLETLMPCSLPQPSQASGPACQGPYPLSYAQESLWLFEQLVPETPVYNIPEAWQLRGPLEVPLLQRSLDEMVRRHEVLRTWFRLRDGKPEQLVEDTARLRLEQIEVPAVANQEAELQRLLKNRACQVFDLGRAPLARVTLFRMGPENHVLLINVHHLISDAWSQGLLMAELASGYSALHAGEPLSNPASPIQYVDFVLWERELAQTQAGQRHLDYWKKQFPLLPDPALLPTDRPRGAVRSHQGETQFLYLPPSLMEPLRELSRRQGATVFMTLFAAFQALVHRYAQTAGIVIGSPMACRERVELEGVLGLFVHTHALRCDLSGDPTFVELLGRVREVILQAFAHQDSPPELLLQGLPVERAREGHPLFQVVFGWQNSPPTRWALPGVEAARIDVETGTAKFDWTLLASDCDGGVKLRSEFSTELFDWQTMARLLHQYQVLLEGIAGNPTERISRLALLTPAETEQLTDHWNRTDSAYERHSRVHEVFELRAAETPEAAALVSAGQQLTYRELNGRANHLAHRLIGAGVGPGSRVGVCFSRSPGMIIAVLAILKSGAAYVPLDPQAPCERLEYLIQDCGATAVVTESGLVDALPVGRARLFVLDGSLTELCPENPRSHGGAETAAYVMYTSGSTGVPKGAVIPHRAVVRLVRNTNYLDFCAELVFLQAAPMAFDAATFEIWGALLNSARLVLLPSGPPSLEQLARAIKENGVTTLWLTAGLFQQMIQWQLESLRGLKHLLAGGDVLSPATVAQAVRELPQCQLINGYGPTENATFTCCFRVPGQWSPARSVPIGRPISNTRVYVLDEHLVPVPIGVPGELYTAGDGLALEYLNRPELTAEKFVPSPFAESGSARLYRTGDRVRWLPDGNLEFLGRLDGQAKIRGYRIEPGEVENALMQHPSVAAAAVIIRDDPLLGKELLAYAVPRPGSEANPDQLREFLARKLPPYLLPAHTTMLNSLPLTENGKLDRRALASPTARAGSREMVAPRNPTEELVADIWRELLGCSRLSIHDDFFKLGGHSLIATQMLFRLSTTFGVELPLRAIFEAPTVARLAALVESGQRSADPGVPSIPRSGPARAAELLQRLEELSEAEIEELLRDPHLKSAL